MIRGSGGGVLWGAGSAVGRGAVGLGPRQLAGLGGLWGAVIVAAVSALALLQLHVAKTSIA